MKLKLTWSPKKFIKHSLIPVFIPFAGCATRCIFCAQDVQSGTKQRAIKVILSELRDYLTQRQISGHSPPELGFFGGTFTAIAMDDFKLCCEFVHAEIVAKRISHARCSTRPDALSTTILNNLKEAGFNLVELGIQSFNDDALLKSQRNYSGFTAKKACQLVKEHGLKLGIQLLPGMPGVDADTFLNDVELALEFNPIALRYYPCQVLKNTQLAKLWERHEFHPWSLNQTIDVLAKAWLMAHEKQVAVIRMGLAPEPHLEKAILAGPRHAALGSLIQAQALLIYIQSALDGEKIINITLPQSCQGFFAGDKNMLWPQWSKLGLSKENISWRDQQYIEIETK